MADLLSESRPPSGSIDDSLAALSPEQRRLLQIRLRERGLDLGRLPIPRRDSATARLSFGQERLWFLENLDPGSARYNVHSAFRLDGAVDESALRSAVDRLVGRHEVLGAAMPLVDGEPVQVFVDHPVIPIRTLDVRGLEPDERASRGDRFIAEEYRRPFDLVNGPLLRVGVILGESAAAGVETDVVISMHHVACDGWSAEILRTDLLELYSSIVDQRAAALPELPIQYGDFSEWQRRCLSEQEVERLLAYWRDTLAGAPEHLDLQARRRSDRPTGENGAMLSFGIPPSVRSPLRELCVSEDATPAMVVFAAYAMMLSRYTQHADLVVGMSVSNRNRAELEHLIGFFVNTLAVRIDLCGDLSFRTLVQRVRQVLLDAHAHQDLPFDLLVKELSPHRELSHNPLFQVFFDFQSAIGAQPAMSMEGVVHGTPVAVAPKFDLSLSVREATDGYLSVFEYRTDLFDDGMVDAMGRHLAAILLGGVSDPDRPVRRLAMMSSDERATTLAAARGPSTEFHGGPVHALVREQVERRPDQPAIVAGRQTLTYREMERAWTNAARRLRRHGVSHRSVVAVFVPRSVDAVISLFAILECGAAYLPIDTLQPADRVHAMLADSDAELVIVTDATAPLLPSPGPPHLTLGDRDGDAASDADGSALDDERVERSVTIDGRDAAAVLYTSGSTGRPKGVVLTHRGLSNVVTAQRELIGVQPDDRVLQFASLGFDAATFELLLALGHGATLCIAPEEIRIPGPQLASHLADADISIAFFPPSALGAVPPIGLPGLRTVCVGGEVCPSDLVETWSPGRRFINLYGPTEAAIWTTAGDCVTEGMPPTIGWPVVNVATYVLDRDGELLPPGVPGELHIGGAGVAQGYINAASLTAAQFVPDPFSGVSGDRMYRTGDRARVGPDGIEFLGRYDDQVKLRGFRVEPGEIAAVLRTHPQVANATVVVRPSVEAGDRLVAYTVPASDRDAVQPDALRAHLRSRLPSYMVPSLFVCLDEIPMLPSGKVDRRTLPDPTEENGAPSPTALAPRSDAERRMAALWSSVLGVPSMGVQDDFFDHGGHSLLVARLATRIVAEFGVEVPLDRLFGARTVEAACAIVDELRADGAETTRIPIAAAVQIPVDELTDSEVTRLLGEVLPTELQQLPAEPEPPAGHPDAELLLAWLDGLSNEIIEAMLRQFYEEANS